MPAHATDLPLGSGVSLLCNDANGLLALNKPGGVRSHPNTAAADPAALLTVAYDAATEAYQWRDHNGSWQTLWLLNRLDAPTSGVILAALSADCADAVRAAFLARAVDKTYLARVFDQARPLHGRWQDRMQTQRTSEGLRSRLGSGPPAHTRYRTLAKAISKGLVTSLLELHPETGRTHQLRVQCQAHGVPVVGDQTYGDFVRNRRFFAAENAASCLCLHAWKIQFKYKLDGKSQHFSACAAVPETLHMEGFAAAPGVDSDSAVKPLATRRFRRP